MNERTRAFRERFRREHIPGWYRGQLHCAITISVLGGSMAWGFWHACGASAACWLLVPAMLLLGNLVVFVVHKYLLHRRIPLVPYAYKAHTQWHHRFFTHEAATWESMRDFFLVLFPIPVVVGFGIVNALVVYGLFGLVLSPAMTHMLFACTAMYFALYETVHLISHLPDANPLTRVPGLAFMRKHHLAHHDPGLMREYNFNIVFPLFDYVFGTVWKGELGTKTTTELDDPA